MTPYLLSHVKVWKCSILTITIYKMKVPNVVKVKMEKAEANKAEWLKAASNREPEVIEKGMEVSLRSPNSLSLAAMGTVQNIDENALGSDGKPLFDYVEVLVNYVINETTKLPRANGRIKTLKGATAKCIPWPRINVRFYYNMYHLYYLHFWYILNVSLLHTLYRRSI